MEWFDEWGWCVIVILLVEYLCCVGWVVFEVDIEVVLMVIVIIFVSVVRMGLVVDFVWMLLFSILIGFKCFEVD